MQKQNIILVQELQYTRTTDLMIAKVSCIRQISLLTTIRAGLMTFVAVLIAGLLKLLYDGESMSVSVFISIMCAFYSIIFTLVIDYVFLTKAIATKEIINDVFAMRDARAKPSSFNNSSKLEKNTPNEN